MNSNRYLDKLSDYGLVKRYFVDSADIKKLSHDDDIISVLNNIGGFPELNSIVIINNGELIIIDRATHIVAFSNIEHYSTFWWPMSDDVDTCYCRIKDMDNELVKDILVSELKKLMERNKIQKL